MSRPDWAPAGVDLDRPNVARMYDYYLGGSHNFRVDREVADQAIAAYPNLPRTAQANRAFLHRAVRYCLDAGIRQFLDIGSGIPTVGNVHEVAQRVDPDARVVYVDTDPIAIAHGRAILAGNDRATAIRADGRQPDAILDDPEVRRVLDLDQPVAVLLVAVLHFVADADRPEELVARLVKRVAPGSLVVITHGLMAEGSTLDGPVLSLYRRTPTPLRPRTRAAIESLFAGLELVDPGVVQVTRWRPDALADPDDNDDWCLFLAGVARKAN
jgi:SAM-dependent methyltransferase